MIEYLYDVIRAVSGQPIKVSAYITEEDGKTPITKDCCLFLYTDTEGGKIVDVNVTTTALYDFMPWNEVVRFFNISKWCYIDDLLSKGGEK